MTRRGARVESEKGDGAMAEKPPCQRGHRRSTVTPSPLLGCCESGHVQRARSRSEESLLRLAISLAISVYGPKIEILGQGPLRVESASLFLFLRSIARILPEEEIGRIGGSRKYLNQRREWEEKRRTCGEDVRGYPINGYVIKRLRSSSFLSLPGAIQERYHRVLVCRKNVSYANDRQTLLWLCILNMHLRDAG